MLGRACVATARYETPTKIVIATTPSTPSVFAAFFDCGWRNALTPFAIDSTPVSALAPDANAFSTRKSVTAATPGGIACGATARGHVLTAHFVTPAPTATSIATMKPYVGSAKVKPDSRMPRRLTTVISTIARSDSSVL